jgi:hypothetical protein
MATHTDSRISRALTSIRRAWADMDRASRLVVDPRR